MENTNNSTYILKLSLIAILAAISNGILGYAFKLLSINSFDLFTQTNVIINFAIYLIIGLFFAITVFSAAGILIEKKLYLSAIMVFSTLGYIIGFSLGPAIDNQTIMSIVIGILVTLGLLRLVINIRVEYLNSIKLRLLVILPKNAHGFLTFLGLVLAINFYVFFNAQVQVKGFSLSENILNKIIEPALTIVEKNMGEQISQQYSKEVSQGTLTTENQQRVLDLLKDQLGQDSDEQTFKEGLNTGTEDIKPTVVSQINKALEPYAKYIPIIAAVSLFFIAESIFSLLPFLLVPFVSFTIFLLKKLNFIKLEKSTAEIERFTI